MAFDFANKFCNYFDVDNSNEAGRLVQRNDFQIVQEGCNIIARKPNSPKYVRGLILLVKTHKPDEYGQVLENVLNLLISNAFISRETTQDIKSTFSLECDKLDTDEVIVLVKTCLKAFQNKAELNPRWIDIFVKLLDILSTKERVVVHSEVKTGQQYHQEIVTTLCNFDWATEAATPLTALFRDITLNSEQILSVATRLCSLLPEMEPQAVPPFTFQLLRLCREEHCLFPCIKLGHYFTRISPRRQSSDVDTESIELSYPLKEIIGAKCTCLLYITQAVRLGNGIAKALIKEWKAKECKLPLDPFMWEVAFSIGSISQFQEQITDLLKSVVLRWYTTEEYKFASAFAREVDQTSLPELHKMLTYMIETSQSNWEEMYIGIQGLAFALLETKPSKSFHIPPSRCPTPYSSNLVWSLAVSLLVSMLSQHSDSFSYIFQTLLGKCIDTGGEKQYIDTLSTICTLRPQVLLQNPAWFTELIELSLNLPVNSGRSLITALFPLLKSTRAPRDGATIILKKALFSKSETGRQLAVYGLLQILKHFKRMGIVVNSQSTSSQSSQASSIVDVHRGSKLPSEVADALCAELMTLLKRSLWHEASVRTTFYLGLCDVVSGNPSLLDSSLGLLNGQLYALKEDSAVLQTSPLKLALTIAEGTHGAYVIKEPLGHLWQALGLLVYKLVSETNTVQNTRDTLDKMMEKFVDVKLEDFDLTEEGDWGAMSSVALRNFLLLRNGWSLYVALVEYALLRNKPDMAMVLRKKMSDWESFWNQVTSGRGAKKGKKKDKDKTDANEQPGVKEPKPSVVKNPPPLVHWAWSSLASAFRTIYQFDDDSGSRQLYEKDEDFQIWLLRHLGEKLQFYISHTTFEGTKASEIKSLMTIGRALFVCVVCPRTSQHRERISQIIYEALHSLELLFKYLFTRHPSEKLRFLVALEGGEDVDGLELESQVMNTADRFCEIMGPWRDKCDEEILYEEIILIASRVLHFVVQDLTNVSNTRKVCETVHTACSRTPTRDTRVSKVLIQILLELYTRVESRPGIMLDVCKQVHYSMGDINEEVSLKRIVCFGVISHDSKLVVLTETVHALERYLEMIGWAVERMKGRQDSELEKQIAKQFDFVVDTLLELCQSSVEPGLGAESLFRLLAKFFDQLGYMAKIQGKIVAQKFEKLVKRIGKELTPKVYGMITHITVLLREDGENKKRKKDGTLAQRQVFRQTRAIPVCVYAIEKCEQHLLKLARRTKVDLSAGYKLGMARDIRIDAKLPGADEQEENEEANGSGEEEEPGPPKKKPKTAKGKTPAKKNTSKTGHNSSKKQAT